MSTKNNTAAKTVKIVKSLSIVVDKKTGESNLVNNQTGKVLAVNWTNFIRKMYKKHDIFTKDVNTAEEIIQKIHKSEGIPLIRLHGTFRHDLQDKKYQNVDNEGIPMYIKEKESIKKNQEKDKAEKRAEKEKDKAKQEKQAAKKTNITVSTKKNTDDASGTKKENVTKKTEKKIVTAKKAETKKSTETKTKHNAGTKKATVKAYCPDDSFDTDCIPDDIKKEMQEENLL